jgi:hypothetical protein
MGLVVSTASFFLMGRNSQESTLEMHQAHTTSSNSAKSSQMPLKALTTAISTSNQSSHEMVRAPTVTCTSVTSSRLRLMV